jgi:UDP-N-acetylmuramate dehydrogenase
MQILQNISLRTYNTFGIDVNAKYFAKFGSVEGLTELFESKFIDQADPPLVLGGGSNILLTHHYNGLVAKNELAGIEVVNEDADHVFVRAGAGENWHRFVMHCINEGYAGLENLSLIPGSVGAAPMQNVGAYGVETKDVFHELQAFHSSDRKLTLFGLEECEFGYRESVFKRRYRGQFVITSVTFKLNKRPVFRTSYGAIQQELEKMNVKELTIKAVSQAVINIRQSKLPDPAEIGNAGSFFKNPTIVKRQFDELRIAFPGIVGFAVNDLEIKVAAGWLIEQCGWKGYRKGDAGCHAKQALVLVNYKSASGEEIYQLSSEIISSVQAKFGITLEREVNVI